MWLHSPILGGLRVQYRRNSSESGGNFQGYQTVPNHSEGPIDLSHVLLFALRIYISHWSFASFRTTVHGYITSGPGLLVPGCKFPATNPASLL